MLGAPCLQPIPVAEGDTRHLSLQAEEPLSGALVPSMRRRRGAQKENKESDTPPPPLAAPKALLFDTPVGSTDEDSLSLGGPTTRRQWSELTCLKGKDGEEDSNPEEEEDNMVRAFKEDMVKVYWREHGKGLCGEHGKCWGWRKWERYVG